MIKEKIPHMEYYSYRGNDSPDPLSDTVATALAKIPHRPLEEVLRNASTATPLNAHKQTMNDKLYYIFTSGTTGTLQ